MDFYVDLPKVDPMFDGGYFLLSELLDLLGEVLLGVDLLGADLLGADLLEVDLLGVDLLGVILLGDVLEVAALPVSGRIAVEDPKMEIKTLPAVKVVSVIYRGPYPGVEAGYNRLFSYAEENSLEPFGPSRELYFNDPAEVPEEELMTEVQIQVRQE